MPDPSVLFQQFPYVAFWWRRGMLLAKGPTRDLNHFAGLLCGLNNHSHRYKLIHRCVYKIKHLGCGMHFVVCSWRDNWPEGKVIHCPECGGTSHFLVKAQLERPGVGEGMRWAGLCHPQGHVREEALIAARRSLSPDYLPLILIRLNDWVPQVRREACLSFEALLFGKHAAVFVRSLPLVDQLQKAARGDHMWVLDSVKELLSLPDSREALDEGLNSPDRLIRRYSLSIALQGNTRSGDLLTSALRDGDVTIRAEALSQLARLSGPEAQSLLEAAMSDPAMRISGRNSLRRRFAGKSQNKACTPHTG